MRDEAWKLRDHVHCMRMAAASGLLPLVRACAVSVACGEALAAERGKACVHGELDDLTPRAERFVFAALLPDREDGTSLPDALTKHLCWLSVFGASWLPFARLLRRARKGRGFGIVHP